MRIIPGGTPKNKPVRYPYNCPFCNRLRLIEQVKCPDGQTRSMCTSCRQVYGYNEEYYGKAK